MKVVEIAPFIFYFKDVDDKKTSYQLLINFLKANGWLNERGDRLSPLSSYHSDEHGICHVILAEDILTEEFINLSEEMFKNLVSVREIKWIKVGFHPATESIIYNNVDKYFQTIPIQNMSTGDMMLVFKR